jgi:hypothetical protein
MLSVNPQLGAIVRTAVAVWRLLLMFVFTFFLLMYVYAAFGDIVLPSIPDTMCGRGGDDDDYGHQVERMECMECM